MHAILHAIIMFHNQLYQKNSGFTEALAKVRHMAATAMRKKDIFGIVQTLETTPASGRFQRPGRS